MKDFQRNNYPFHNKLLWKKVIYENEFMKNDS